jgi:hypothetical protein
VTGRDKNIIILVLSVIILVGFFFFGYSMYPRWNPKPVVVTNTIIKVDTFEYTIRDTIPWYVVRKDTIFLRDTIPKIIDTAAILNKYYAFHNYYRVWEDSLLRVELNDVISENKSVDNLFRYKILMAQTVINKTEISYSYSRYLYVGLTVPVMDARYAEFKILYAFPKGFAGVGYNPHIRSPTLSGGIRIAKFK